LSLAIQLREQRAGIVRMTGGFEAAAHCGTPAKPGYCLKSRTLVEFENLESREWLLHLFRRAAQNWQGLLAMAE